jgi:hypothetical protein
MASTRKFEVLHPDKARAKENDKERSATRLLLMRGDVRTGRVEERSLDRSQSLQGGAKYLSLS